jgi:hypothetical protein
MRSRDLPTRPQSRALFLLAREGGVISRVSMNPGTGTITLAHGDVSQWTDNIVYIRPDGGMRTTLPADHGVRQLVTLERRMKVAA